jgi:hypothetical protein
VGAGQHAVEQFLHSFFHLPGTVRV